MSNTVKKPKPLTKPLPAAGNCASKPIVSKPRRTRVQPKVATTPAAELPVANDHHRDHRIAPASSSHQSKSAEPRRPAAKLGRPGATAARLNPSAPADLKTQKSRTGEKWHGIAVA